MGPCGGQWGMPGWSPKLGRDYTLLIHMYVHTYIHTVEGGERETKVGSKTSAREREKSERKKV